MASKPTIDKVTLDTTGFDLDTWLEGAAPPERVVVVHGRGDLAGEYEQLENELRDANEAASGAASSGMMNSASAARAREIAERMSVIRADFEASKLTIRLRAISKDVQADITAGASSVADGERPDWIAEQYIAASAVRPAFTVEQVRKLRSRCGEGQFLALYEAAVEVSVNRSVEVPFSLAHSATLATPGT